MMTMMKNNWIYTVVCTFIAVNLFAQTQDTISRSVTVEREFQPVISSAGKMSVKPQRIEEQQPQASVEYSDYSRALKADFNVSPLRSSSIRFNQPNQGGGYLKAGVGHKNTLLDFQYAIFRNGKRPDGHAERSARGIDLNIWAKHDAEWGRSTWETSTIGMDFMKRFSEYDVYFDVNGGNLFYTRYGRYYDGDGKLSIKSFGDLKKDDKQSIWDVHTNVGMRSKKDADITWWAETGYNAYVMERNATEHKIRTQGNVEWNGEAHHAGATLTVQNAFYTIADEALIPKGKTNPKHNIRLNPYYRYENTSVRVCVGANIDMNVGEGKFLSGNGNLSFAPSPDIDVEYRIIPSWLALYGGAKGQFDDGLMRGYVNMNPYLVLGEGITSEHVCAYTPVDAYLGLKIKPIDNMLIDVHARYAYLMNNAVFYADQTMLDPRFFYSDWQRWTVGAELTWHYQDIVHILADGHYYHWTMEDINTQGENVAYTRTNYDRPMWDANLRVDCHIDSKWSLYLHSYFAGARKALTSTGNENLKCTVDINIGARYEFNKWLAGWVELDNIIHRHNDIYYHYQSQGIHGLIGISWKF